MAAAGRGWTATHHLGNGLKGAVQRPGLILAQTGLDLLAVGVGLLPPLLLLGGVIGRLASGLQRLPFSLTPIRLLLSDLLLFLTDPGRLAALAGLWLSGALLVGTLRLLYLTGAFGRLAADVLGDRRPGRFMDAVVGRFAAAVGQAAALLVGRVALWGWTAGVLAAGMAGLARGVLPGGDRAGAAAAGAALAVTLALLVPLAFDAVARLALVRTVTLGEGPLVAVWEGARTLLRRPLQVLALGVAIWAALVVVTLTLAGATGLAGLLPETAADTAWAWGASAVGAVLRTVTAAVVAVAAQGAFTSLVLDDAGRLPPRPVPVPAVPVAPRGPVLRAVPVAGRSGAEPVYRAVPASAEPAATSGEGGGADRSEADSPPAGAEGDDERPR